MNDHDLLVRIDEKVSTLHALMVSHQSADEDIHEDMEDRLRLLEASKNSQKGAVAAVTSVVSAFWALAVFAFEAWRHR